jgi:hypothetical protein
MGLSPMLGATCVRSRMPASQPMRLGTVDASATICTGSSSCGRSPRRR